MQALRGGRYGQVEEIMLAVANLKPKPAAAPPSRYPKSKKALHLSSRSISALMMLSRFLGRVGERPAAEITGVGTQSAHFRSVIRPNVRC